jgi:hypothetical protein
MRLLVAHPDIDGTGWVREAVDGYRITAAGPVFRMAMYHPNHPDKDYKIANRVAVCDVPRAIAWKSGTESPRPANSASAAGSTRPCCVKVPEQDVALPVAVRAGRVWNRSTASGRGRFQSASWRPVT